MDFIARWLAMDLLERKTRSILYGKNLTPSQARGEVSARFRLNKKEAGLIIKRINLRG